MLKSSLDAAFGIVSFVPGWGWVASGGYFVVNLGIQAYTGKSIGQHIDDNVMFVPTPIPTMPIMPILK
jgi:hypothetical protein